MHRQGGDDLEDDFIPDDLVALDEDEDEDEDLYGDQFDVTESGLHFNEDSGEINSNDNGRDTGAVEKKRKQEKQKQKKEKKKRKLVDEVNCDEPISIAARSPFMLAEYLSSMQAKTFPTMSAIEREDIQIPNTAIADTTAWTGPRTLEHLTGFIAKVLPALHIRLSQRSKSNGAPTLLFITGAALRVADVTRIFKDKKLRGEKGGEVAKLFARHFKLEEHVTSLRKTKIGVAVGTPGRVGKLLCDTDAFTLSALTHIMLDVSFRDTKQRSLLDIPENRDEVFKTVLRCPGILEAIKAANVQLVLF